MTPVDMAASMPIGLGAARMARMRSNWSSGMDVAQGLFLEEDFLEGDFLDAMSLSRVKEKRKAVIEPGVVSWVRLKHDNEQEGRTKLPARYWPTRQLS
jgi:hypothetical protein